MVLDLKVIIRMILKHIILIILISLIAAAGGYYYATYRIAPTYRTSVQMVVQTSSNLSGESSVVTGSDISTAEKMVSTCSIIFKDKMFLSEIREATDNKYSIGQLSGMISVYGVNDSEILGVSVTSTDPQACADIANAFLKNAPLFFKNIYENAVVVALSEAEAPVSPSGPDVKRYAYTMFIAAFVLSTAIAFLLEFFNTKVTSDDNLAERYGIPVFAEIPDFSELQDGNEAKGGAR